MVYITLKCTQICEKYEWKYSLEQGYYILKRDERQREIALIYFLEIYYKVNATDNQTS